MKKLNQLPNNLSCIRVVLSISLLFISSYVYVFITCYLLCGISDILDGYLARKLKAQSALGSNLDTFADFIFTMVYLYFLITMIRNQFLLLMVMFITIVAVFRLINVIYTKNKFNRFGIMHTTLNKTVGVCMFIMLPFWFIHEEIFLIIMIITFVVACLSSIEETWMISRLKVYDSNLKGICSIKNSNIKGDLT